MRYRIKIVKYGDGKLSYFPHVKAWIGWNGIGSDGTEYDGWKPEVSSRDAALKSIDQHFNGANRVQSIEFEYINK